VTRQNRVGRSTNNGYADNQARFVQWLSANKPEQLNRNWVALVYQDVKDEALRDDADLPVLDDAFKKPVKARLKNYDRHVSPLNYERFSVQDALVYFQQLKVQARSKGPHRAAVRALFEHYGRPVPPTWESETKEVFAGMKRVEAQARQQGVLIAPSGKEHRRGGKRPLTVQMYTALNRAMYSRGERPFKVLFILLLWNLMS
jgi:hypothetical protein